MRWFTALATATCLVESVASTAWISTSRTQRRNNNSPASQGFVTTQNGQFFKDDKPFAFFATNAYYLAHMSDADINTTMAAIAKANISVVRTWAFNDVVDQIPETGAWFQAFNPNGTITINTGPNGLQRLDRILDIAHANGLMVQLALTNNWNPVANQTNQTEASVIFKRDNTTTSNFTLPRGSLSNDYGGMDSYLRFHNLSFHDEFYSNQTIIDAFTNYLNVLVPRYKNRTELVAWELANDARCNSTLPHSGTCDAQRVTKWHDTLSRTVKTLDPNHLVASGTHGFICAGCPKLFPRAPRPQPSPAPGKKKRDTAPLTAKKILSQRRAKAKRNEEAAKTRVASAAEKRTAGEPVKWRYRGKAREVKHGKRQEQATLGSAFDGTHGVDSEDIINIPQIGFGSFQLFPDQNVYGVADPSLSSFNNTVETGIEWITQQAMISASFGKPAFMTGFGLVTQDNLPAFVPFNASQTFLPTNASGTQAVLPTPTGLGEGLEQGQIPVTNAQQETAYQQWIQAAIDNEVFGIANWQWGQNLPPAPPPATTQQQNTFVPSIPPVNEQQQTTPNDGYQAISSSLQAVLTAGAIAQQNIIPA